METNTTKQTLWGVQYHPPVAEGQRKETIRVRIPADNIDAAMASVRASAPDAEIISVGRAGSIDVLPTPAA